MSEYGLLVGLFSTALLQLEGATTAKRCKHPHELRDRALPSAGYTHTTHTLSQIHVHTTSVAHELRDRALPSADYTHTTHTLSQIHAHTTSVAHELRERAIPGAYIVKTAPQQDWSGLRGT